MNHHLYSACRSGLLVLMVYVCAFAWATPPQEPPQVLPPDGVEPPITEIRQMESRREILVDPGPPAVTKDGLPDVPSDTSTQGVFLPRARAPEQCGQLSTKIYQELSQPDGIEVVRRRLGARCLTEARRVLSEVRACRLQPTVLVPGNHSGPVDERLRALEIEVDDAAKADAFLQSLDNLHQKGKDAQVSLKEWPGQAACSPCWDLWHAREALLDRSRPLKTGSCRSLDELVASKDPRLRDMATLCSDLRAFSSKVESHLIKRFRYYSWTHTGEEFLRFNDEIRTQLLGMCR